MAVLFTGIKIFTCEGDCGEVHGELVVVNCGPGNIIRGYRDFVGVVLSRLEGDKRSNLQGFEG